MNCFIMVTPTIYRALSLLIFHKWGSAAGLGWEPKEPGAPLVGQ